MAEQISVSYELFRDWLDDIRKSVASIDLKLDQKADASMVFNLSQRLGLLEIEIARRSAYLEQFKSAQQEIENLKSWRNRTIGAAGIALFLGSAAFLKMLGIHLTLGADWLRMLGIGGAW